MSPFQGTVELPGDFVPEVKQQETPLVSERVKELGNEQYLEKLEFWKERIDDALDGEFGKGEVFTNKEEGIQHVTSEKSTFFVIDKNSPLPVLSKKLRETLREAGFSEVEGSKNFVYSKFLKKDAEKKKDSLLSRFF